MTQSGNESCGVGGSFGESSPGTGTAGMGGPPVPPSDTAPLGAKIRVFAGDIKIAHTVFALPFALLATFMAARGWPKMGQLALILLCMVTARTAAMASNRLLDARLDAINPRTARRAIPSGELSAAFYWIIAAICAAGFILSTALFNWIYGNPWPLIGAAPVLLFLAAYPLLKRFSAGCHYYLGAALGLAPLCAWIAIDGKLEASPFIIGAAVLLWTAGFDIIYACQDHESDRETGVFSIPAKIGIGGALWVSRLTHACAASLLIALGFTSPQLGALYLIGASAATLLLIIEQSLVRPADLSKVNVAFFTMNGTISLLLGLLGIVDVLI